MTFESNVKITFQESVFKNIVCKMAAILSVHWSVKTLAPSDSIFSFREWLSPPLVQGTTCRLLDANWLPQPILTPCRLELKQSFAISSCISTSLVISTRINRHKHYILDTHVLWHTIRFVVDTKRSLKHYVFNSDWCQPGFISLVLGTYPKYIYRTWHYRCQ